jgi:hypothetical protein
MLSDQELYHTLNSNPAKIWQQWQVVNLKKVLLPIMVIAKAEK